MARVADAGRWRDAYAILRAHGPDSAEWATFVASVLGTRDCPACGGQFVATDGNVRYCSPACSKRGYVTCTPAMRQTYRTRLRRRQRTSRMPTADGYRQTDGQTGGYHWTMLTRTGASDGAAS